MTGLFMENGPARVDKNIKVVNNPSSWNSNASVIYLDQPVNTGFSYSPKSVKTSAAASKDVFAFLTLFFKQYPEYASQDFHISGESYSGHYIPVFSADILAQDDTNINLKSILIGNGLTDEYAQYEYYQPMGCGDGGYPAVLDSKTCDEMKSNLPTCQKKIQACYDDPKDVKSCVSASSYCNENFITPFQETGKNVYDVREKCEDEENLCYPIQGWIEKYLNKKDVMDAIGAEVLNFQGCSDQVNSDFTNAGDWSLPIMRKVPEILAKIPVLIYAGDADYICNWLGNHAWSDALEWPGKDKFKAAPMNNVSLSDGGKAYGQIKNSGGFAFLRVYEAGHMVPYNQPEPCLNFVNRWLGGEWAK